MVISTSSHNVHLTDKLCEYIQGALRERFRRFGDHVVSVDARLEAIDGRRDRHDIKAIIRVDLRNHRALATEIVDDSLYAAIRRSATDSARAVARQLSHSRQVNGQRPLEKFHALGRYTAANI
ncbi:MAG: HPF/RaiA family ribosome-associated protein [Woeseiaceae bacterium]|nr:HPF/RaiA family ribosome-associated protein [Woeseiaceae bacterium]